MFLFEKKSLIALAVLSVFAYSPSLMAQSIKPVTDESNKAVTPALTFNDYRYLSAEFKGVYDEINKDYSEISIGFKLPLSQVNEEARIKMNKSGDLFIFSKEIINKYERRVKVYFAGFLNPSAADVLGVYGLNNLSFEQRSQLRYVNKNFLKMVLEESKNGKLKSQTQRFSEVGLYNLLQFLPPVSRPSTKKFPYYDTGRYNIVFLEKEKSPDDEYLLRMNRDADGVYVKSEDVSLISKYRNEMLVAGKGKDILLPVGEYKDAIEKLNENLSVINLSGEGVGYSILLSGKTFNSGNLKANEIYRVVPSAFLKSTTNMETLKLVSLYGRVSPDGSMVVSNSVLDRVKPSEKNWMTDYKDNLLFNPTMFKDFMVASELSLKNVKDVDLNFIIESKKIKLFIHENRLFVMTPLVNLTNKKSNDVAIVEVLSSELYNNEKIGNWKNIQAPIKIFPYEYVEFLSDSNLIVPLFEKASNLTLGIETLQSGEMFLERMKSNNLGVKVVSINKLDPFSNLSNNKLSEVVFDWKSKFYKFEIPENKLGSIVLSSSVENKPQIISKDSFFKAEPILNYRVKIY